MIDWVFLRHEVTTVRRKSSLFLRRSSEIERVKRVGRRVSTTLFNLLIRTCEDDKESKLGIVLGRRFGTAVSRNRAKRLFRELAREVHGNLLPGRQFLVFPKRECLIQPFPVLRDAWKVALQRCRLGIFNGDLP
ncbi:MAG: ribonuclease P protein component [Nitrospiraceae bacterium]